MEGYPIGRGNKGNMTTWYHSRNGTITLLLETIDRDISAPTYYFLLMRIIGLRRISDCIIN